MQDIEKGILDSFHLLDFAGTFSSYIDHEQWTNFMFTLHALSVGYLRSHVTFVVYLRK